MAQTPSRIADAVLSAGLAARLTRFVVTEDLGGWLVRYPLHEWAMRSNPTPLGDGVPVSEQVVIAERTTQQWQPFRERATWVPTWRNWLAEATSCGFCTGTWLHLGAQAVNAVLPDSGPARTLWRVLTVSQTAAWLLGNLSKQLGDFGYADDDEATGA